MLRKASVGNDLHPADLDLDQQFYAEDLSFMSSNSFTRRLMVVAAGGALIAMGAFTAGCGNKGEQAPSTTTTTTTTTTATTPPSSAAPPSPTEKGTNPTGGNLFSPQILAPPAPTEPPGVHRRN